MKKIIKTALALFFVLAVCCMLGCTVSPAQDQPQPFAQTSATSAPVPTPTPTLEPTPTPTPTPNPTPSPEGMFMLAEGFTSQPIPGNVKQRMIGKSFPGEEVLSWNSLRYLNVLHMGFDGEVHEGELVVNESIAEDVLHIMKGLYDSAYPIEKMVLIDDYDANDEASMTDNNTSAFCYRFVNGTEKLSNHAYGIAIDINPLYNPYVKGDVVEPKAGIPYADRLQDNPYFIREGDLCYQLFTEYGFTWGGDWSGNKDYQHFDLR